MFLDKQCSFNLVLLYFTGLLPSFYSVFNVDLSVVERQWLRNWWNIDCVADMSGRESCLSHYPIWHKWSKVLEVLVVSYKNRHRNINLRKCHLNENIWIRKFIKKCKAQCLPHSRCSNSSVAFTVLLSQMIKNSFPRKQFPLCTFCSQKIKDSTFPYVGTFTSLSS